MSGIHKISKSAFPRQSYLDPIQANNMFDDLIEYPSNEDWPGWNEFVSVISKTKPISRKIRSVCIETSGAIIGVHAIAILIFGYMAKGTVHFGITGLLIPKYFWIVSSILLIMTSLIDLSVRFGFFCYSCFQVRDLIGIRDILKHSINLKFTQNKRRISNILLSILFGVIPIALYSQALAL